MSTSTRGKPHTKVLGAVIALLMVAMGAWVNPSQAFASIGPAALTPGFIGVKNPIPPTGNGREMGTGVLPNGVRGICIDTGALWPSSTTTPYTVTDYKTAWLLAAYSNTSNDYEAAALWYLVNGPVGGYDSNQSQLNSGWTQGNAVYGAQLQNTANAMVATMDAQAGPYDANVSLGPTTQPNGLIKSGTAYDIGLQNASGAWQAGYNMNVTLEGPATWNATGTQVLNIWSTAGPQSFDWTATGDGIVKVRITIDGIYSDFTVYPPQGPGYQRIVAVANPTSISYSDPAPADVAVLADATATTTTSKAHVTETLVDTITISGGAPNSTLPVTSKLYGPLATQPAQSATVPAGAPVVTTVTNNVVLDANGAATTTVTSPTLNQAGWYTWVTSWPEDANNAGFQHDFGVPAETTYVGPWKPAVTTQSQHVVVAPNSPLTDTVSVTGLPANTQFSGTSTLYGPFPAQPAQAATVPAGAPVVGTATFLGTSDANGAATVETTILTVVQEGYYVWVETLNQGTKDTVVIWEKETGPFGVPSESTLSYQPDVSTQVSKTEVLVGTPISDTVIVSGIKTTMSGHAITNTVTGSLYGPVAPLKDANGEPTCVGVDWTGAPVAATIAAFTVNADGSYPGKGTFTPSKGGCYTYAETLTWTVANSTDTGTVKHDAGHVTQTTLVNNLTVNTEVNNQVVGVNTGVTDTITVNLTGGLTGTIAANLYGPLQPTDGQKCSSITAQEWQDAIKNNTNLTVGTDIIRYDGDSTVTTKAIIVTEIGCYTWEVTATPDLEDGTVNNTGRVTSPAGELSETTIAIQPVITTQATTPNSNVAGQAIVDTIKVAGTFGNGGTLTGKLVGPMDPVTAGTCTGIDWSNAPVFKEHAAVKFAGDGDYTTEAITTPKHDGDTCYSFVQTVTMDSDAVPVIQLPAGIESETVFMTGSGGGVGVGTGFGTLTGTNAPLGIAGLVVTLIAAGALGRTFRQRARSQG